MVKQNTTSSKKSKKKKINRSKNETTPVAEQPDTINVAKKEAKPKKEEALRVWRPGLDSIPSGETLDYDPTAYDMMQSVTLDWSCLSFDVIPDALGLNRSTFPHTAYIVSGTQADKIDKNRIFVMKWSNLDKCNADEDSDDDMEDEDEDSDAKLSFNVINHKGTTNRIRCCPPMNRLVATWSDTGKVFVWDISEQLSGLEIEGKFTSPIVQPLFTFGGHSNEGYAMAWNPHVIGSLVTGDNDGNLYLWERAEGGWVINTGDGAFKRHGSAVEDIQWKTRGDGMGEVFATASVDKAIRVFDCRQPNRMPIRELHGAHNSDINVLSWNPIQEYLLVSGDDEGCCKAWDLRFFDMPVAMLHWHKSAITSIDWHPTDESVFACSSGDDSISLWDLSVEPDTEATDLREDTRHYPDQFMFHHLGQQQITEIKFHHQIPGVLISTAVDGFNIFKTCNI